MTLDDNQVLVKVDEVRLHDVFIGWTQDHNNVPQVYMTTIVPNVSLHLRMTPEKAREVGVSLIAFADQIEGVGS